MRGFPGSPVVKSLPGNSPHSKGISLTLISKYRINCDNSMRGFYGYEENAMGGKENICFIFRLEENFIEESIIAKSMFLRRQGWIDSRTQEET